MKLSYFFLSLRINYLLAHLLYPNFRLNYFEKICRLEILQMFIKFQSAILSYPILSYTISYYTIYTWDKRSYHACRKPMLQSDINQFYYPRSEESL